MIKIYSKYFYLFTIAIISLVLLNGGCVTQPDRIVAIENRLDAVSKSVEGLEPEINELREKLDKQESGIESTLSSQRLARNHLEKELSETDNLLKEIKQNLALVEEDKGKMKVQLDELGTQLNRLESLSKISSAETNLTYYPGRNTPAYSKVAWGCIPYHASAAHAQTRYRRACHFSKSFCDIKRVM